MLFSGAVRKVDTRVMKVPVRRSQGALASAGAEFDIVRCSSSVCGFSGRSFVGTVRRSTPAGLGQLCPLVAPSARRDDSEPLLGTPGIDHTLVITERDPHLGPGME